VPISLRRTAASDLQPRCQNHAFFAIVNFIEASVSFCLIYCSGSKTQAAEAYANFKGPMSKSKGLMIIQTLRAIFDNRPHRRDAALGYLTEIYKIVRKHSWIRDDVDLELEGEPRTENLFAHLIEVTSVLAPKTRSKFARVLKIADDQNIHYTKFELFIRNSGGFNKVIAKHRTVRRPYIGQWR
jgi:hypothetical protein